MMSRDGVFNGGPGKDRAVGSLMFGVFNGDDDDETNSVNGTFNGGNGNDGVRWEVNLNGTFEAAMLTITSPKP
jgi:hypothetical protein